ncbi:MAG TPA: hypothetical protein VGH94_06990, partial [Acidimicrobiales bacterium]
GLAVFLLIRRMAAHRKIVERWEGERAVALDAARDMAPVSEASVSTWASLDRASLETAWHSEVLNLDHLRERLRVVIATAPDAGRAVGVQKVSDAVDALRASIDNERALLVGDDALRPSGMTPAVSDAHASLRAALAEAQKP